MRVNFDAGSAVNLANRYQVENHFKKSLEKLSTGLRINRASDDAAGLSVSEQLRTQIRGSAQAARNIEDAISLTQIADGALNEVQSILQRLRELAIQANNDTLTATERSYIQVEMDKMVDQIDQIDASTQYNGKSLFEESVDSTLARQLLDGMRQTWLDDGIAQVLAAYGALTDVSGVDIDVYLDEGGTFAAYVLQSGPGNNMELHLNTSTPSFAGGYDAATNESGGSTVAGSTAQADRVITHELTHALMAQNMSWSTQVNVGSNAAFGNTWFTEGTAEYSHGGDDRLKYDIGDASPSVAVADAFIAGSGQIDNIAWSGTSAQYASAYAAVSYMDNSLGILDTVMTRLVAGDTLDAAIAFAGSPGITDAATFLADYAANGGTYINSMTFEALGFGEVLVGAKVNDGTSENVITNNVDPAEVINSSFNFVFQPIADDLTMQVGPNNETHDQITLRRSSVDRVTLQLENLDVVTSGTTRLSALSNVDSAITSVNTKRSDWGAIANRFESALNNIKNSEYNLQDAESRIRDVDFAIEMTEFTKNQILMQSGTTLLRSAQANRAQVLNLVAGL